MKKLLTRLTIASSVALALYGCSPIQIADMNSSDNYIYSIAPTTQESINFWRDFSRTFTVNHYEDNPAVIEQINWFQAHPKYFHRILVESSPYLYYVYSEVKIRNLPGELALLPLIESSYDPRAYSVRGASGMWQLMPKTASGYGVKKDRWYDGSRDVSASTTAALKLLTNLNRYFNGDWLLTFAAYNCGDGKVTETIEVNMHQGQEYDFWHLPLPHETEIYVPRILALAAIIENPRKYGMSLPAMKDSPFFAVITVNKPIDLNKVAKLAGIEPSVLAALNPDYSHKLTEPNRPSEILLPVDKVDTFKANIANMTAKVSDYYTGTEITYHKISHGETLATIAKKYHVSVTQLKSWNKINKKTTRLHNGRHLIINVSQTTTNHRSRQLKTQSNTLKTTKKTAKVQHHTAKKHKKSLNIHKKPTHPVQKKHK